MSNRRACALPACAFLLATLGFASAARAAAPDVMADVRADQWAQAAEAAAQYPDPVAGKLVTYLRLLAPASGSAAELGAFMAENPDWPAQATLARRRDEALASEPGDAEALSLCAQAPPHLAAAMLRCATAQAAAGQAGATDLARQAWLTGLTDPATEAAFLQRWSGVLSDADQAARFDRLAWSDPEAAARQLTRLPASAQPVARVRLALRHDDPSAAAMLAALPAAGQHDPSLVYEQARWLRRAGQDEAALALWRADGAAAQHAASPERLPAFWAERSLLARHRLAAGDAAGAYALAAEHGQTAPEQVADAEFLAGFIALRRLSDPASATAHFQALARVSRAAITQGRAQYWLGRAIAAAGGDPHPAYAAASAWPTTFYGQLAALALDPDPAALDGRIAGLHDPGWDREAVLGFASREVTRAAALLVAWGEPRRARSFILRLDELAPDDADRALAARFAIGLGLPDEAVAVARRAGRDGLMLPDTGWPLAADPPEGPIEPAVTLGLIRQESSFDPQATSPAGARGLMQLMPATAQAVGRQFGVPVGPGALGDPAVNMRLGTAYLKTVLDQFDQALPLAVAAYNAGPNRVLEWLAENGDPRLAGVPGQPAMLDWVELIPFAETRNYVQRVIENVVIYRARLRQSHAGAAPLPAPLPHPVLAAAHS